MDWIASPTPFEVHRLKRSDQGDGLGGAHGGTPAVDRALVFDLREIASGTPLTLGRLLRMPFAGRHR